MRNLIRIFKKVQFLYSDFSGVFLEGIWSDYPKLCYSERMKFLIVGLLLLLLGGYFLIPLEHVDTGVGEAIPLVGETTEKSSEVSGTQTPQEKGTHLDMSGKGLTSVPMNIFARTDVTSLDLSDNLLTGALQAEVRQLQNLEVLDLSDNKFTGVPAEVGQLSRLKTLDLSNNKLTGLPHELGNLKALETLDLRGNAPSEFDLSIIRASLTNTTILID